MVDWRVSFYAYSLIISAALSVVVSWVIWRRRTKPGAVPLAFLMLAVAEWSIANAFEATTFSLSEKILWSQISYIGVVSATPLFFIFALEYTSNRKKISRWLLIATWVIPVITLCFSSTNNLHNLVWSSYEFVPNSSTLIYHHGFVFWVHIAYLYTLLAITSGMLVWNAIRNRNIYREQASTLLIAVPIPIIWNVLYLAGVSPLQGMDLTPVAFALAGFIIEWGIFRNRLFDIVPVERDAIIENLTDGIIIIDTNSRIVDLNQAATDMINIPADKAVGGYLSTLSPILEDRVHCLDFRSLGSVEFQLREQPVYHVEMRFFPLNLKNKAETSYAVILRDITDKELAKIALRDSEQRNQSLMENAALPVTLLNPKDFSILYANQRINSLLDEPILNFLGKNIERNFEKPGEIGRILRLSKKNKLVNDYEASMVTAIGRKIWVLISANLTTYENKEALFLTFNDITARKLVEEAEKQQRILSDALRSSVSALNSTLNFDEVLDRILSSLEKVIPHDIANIMMVDESGYARVVRARGYEASGLEKILTKMNIQVAETPNFLRMAVTGAPLVIEDTRKEQGWVHLEGTEFVRSYIGTPILVKGRVVGYINLDSTKPGAFDNSHADRLQIFADQAAIAIENARMFEKVEQMAIVDTLTGLYNRRHFYDLGEREIERYKRYHSPLSLIMLDLDHFKKVNDQYGHQVGDYVLQELAKIFANSLRKMDIPGRLGGEEFVILLPETNLDQGMLVAERLRQKIDTKDFVIEGHSIHITASMGLVSMSDDESSLQMLISMADKVMYQAKAAGRNKVLAADDHLTLNP